MGIVAVAYEAVAAGEVESGIDDGPCAVEVVFEECSPGVFADAVESAAEGLGAVVEVLSDGVFDAGVVDAVAGDDVGAAAGGGGGVVGGEGDAGVVHEGGYGLDFLLRAKAVEGVGHVLPIVGGVGEVGGEGAVGGVVVGFAAATGGGVVPVFHDLCHGGGYASGGGMGAGSVGGAEVVVVGALTPGGCEEWGDG